MSQASSYRPPNAHALPPGHTCQRRISSVSDTNVLDAVQCWDEKDVVTGQEIELVYAHIGTMVGYLFDD